MFRILLFISFFCLQSQAAIINQDSLMLSATVIDEVQEPLPYATVMLNNRRWGNYKKYDNRPKRGFQFKCSRN